MVTHIDDATIAALTNFYAEFLHDSQYVLDLMSSWVSHFPSDLTFIQTTGLGMNADELAAKHENVFVIHHEKNRGYGGALKTGMRHGLEKGYDIFAIVHSDGQYAPELVMDLCKPIENGETEIVQGSRILGGAREGRQLDLRLRGC